MNIHQSKPRQALGQFLVNQEYWRRNKIRGELQQLGLTRGQWKAILTNAEAHKLPTYVRDVIVEEWPDAEKFFKHPKLAEACSSQLELSQ